MEEAEEEQKDDSPHNADEGTEEATAGLCAGLQAHGLCDPVPTERAGHTYDPCEPEPDLVGARQEQTGNVPDDETQDKLPDQMEQMALLLSLD